jgi:hypothetical protein
MTIQFEVQKIQETARSHARLALPRYVSEEDRS